MPRVPAPFKVKTPFPSRVIGLNYEAFGIDFINPIVNIPTTPRLVVDPDSPIGITGSCDVAYVPSSVVFTLSNFGREPLDWMAASSVTWMTLDVTSGTLAGLADTLVTATLHPDLVDPSDVAYTGIITFTNLTNGLGDTIVNLSFTKSDATDVSDDFEQYPVGPIAILDAGSCWPRDGYFLQIEGWYVWDDFETYPVGPITLLTDGVEWLSDGYFIDGYLYDRAYDDFESYSVGPISSLTFTAPDSLWAAPGFFFSYP